MMKRRSLFAGLVYGFLTMILLPLIVIYINETAGFPRITGVIPEVVGMLLILSGGALLIYATRQFRKHGHGGSPLPFDPPHRLVTQGVFQYSRNPMFVASAMIWLGEFLFFGSLLLLPYALAWIVFNHVHLVKQDEKWLEQRFGKHYLVYKKKTARYIPGVV